MKRIQPQNTKPKEIKKKPVRGLNWKQENDDDFDLWRKHFGCYSQETKEGNHDISLRAENEFLDEVFAQWGDDWFSMQKYKEWITNERRLATKMRNKTRRREQQADLNEMDKIRQREVK